MSLTCAWVGAPAGRASTHGGSLLAEHWAIPVHDSRLVEARPPFGASRSLPRPAVEMAVVRVGVLVTDQTDRLLRSEAFPITSSTHRATRECWGIFGTTSEFQQERSELLDELDEIGARQRYIEEPGEGSDPPRARLRPRPGRKYCPERPVSRN